MRDAVSDADVFVVTTSTDPHVEAVLSRLDGRVRICRLDADRYPVEHQLTIRADQGSYTLLVQNENGLFNVTRPKLAWFRRTGKPGLHPNIDGSFVKFAVDESEQVLQGALDLVRPKSWINPFRATRLAASKPYQVVRAAECGLLTPSTLFTNRPSDLEQFAAEYPTSIIKSISKPLLTSGDSAKGRLFAYTSLLDVDDLRPEQVAYVPSQFQPLVDVSAELRVTTVGRSHHVVAIGTTDSRGDRRDWRATQDTAVYTSAFLDPATVAKLELLLETLQLSFAASDFIVTKQGETVFLEANPHGAWLWLEKAIPNLGITNSFAEYVDKLV